MAGVVGAVGGGAVGGAEEVGGAMTIGVVSCGAGSAPAETRPKMTAVSAIATTASKIAGSRRDTSIPPTLPHVPASADKATMRALLDPLPVRGGRGYGTVFP